MLATQLAVIAALIGIDIHRRRVRPRTATFPHSRPGDSTIGDSIVTPYTYGEYVFADMLAAIGSARHRIYFGTFIWKSDDIGQAFKSALIAAAERGVEVYVVFDGFANVVVTPSFKRFPPSVHVLEYPIFNQGWRIFDLRRSGRDHRKILVIDGEIGFIGGFNVGLAYARQWRDTHARIVGPSVWDLENAFVDFWNLHAGTGRPQLEDRGSPVWEARIRAHRNVPRLWVFPIRAMYLDAIDRARDRVWITQAYFIPDSEIRSDLLAASHRGVDVRILLPERSNHVVADWLSRGFYSPLLRGGVRLFLYQAAMVHAKTATIDGAWTTIGTTTSIG